MFSNIIAEQSLLPPQLYIEQKNVLLFYTNSLKLCNPTDTHLNENFANHNAGIKYDK